MLYVIAAILLVVSIQLWLVSARLLGLWQLAHQVSVTIQKGPPGYDGTWPDAIERLVDEVTRLRGCAEYAKSYLWETRDPRSYYDMKQGLEAGQPIDADLNFKTRNRIDDYRLWERTSDRVLERNDIIKSAMREAETRKPGT